jgi:hypothetical protein
LAAEVRFFTVIPCRHKLGKNLPQGLKPSLLWLFTARLKPCPSYKAFFRSLFSQGGAGFQTREKALVCNLRALALVAALGGLQKERAWGNAARKQHFPSGGD